MTDAKIYRYKAIINTAPQDIAFARWLQKNIENYTIANDVQQKNPNFPNDLRSRIFLYEEPFSSGESLPQTLQEEMDNAQSMIVLCSPRALLSKRVEDQIRYFRSKDERRKIITVLIEGKTENVIPQSLYNGDTVPLLIDMSQPKTRKKAFLKVVASLLDVDVDTLGKKKVEKKHKKQLLKIVIAVLLLLMVVVYSYMKEFSVTPNKELEQIEKKIVTLKQAHKVQKGDTQSFEQSSMSLKKLEALKHLKEESLKYFDFLGNTEAEEVYNKEGVDAALSVLGASTVDKKDDTYAVKNILFAKLYSEKGDLEKAKQYYANAVNADAFDAYLPKEEKAEVLQALAELYTHGETYEKAEKIYREALVLYEALAKDDPSKYEYALHEISDGLAKTLSVLALRYKDEKQLEKAKKYYRETLLLERTLYRQDPDMYRDRLQNSLNALARILSQTKSEEEARKLFEEADSYEKLRVECASSPIVESH